MSDLAWPLVALLCAVIGAACFFDQSRRSCKDAAIDDLIAKLKRLSDSIPVDLTERLNALEQNQAFKAQRRPTLGRPHPQRESA